MADTQQIAPAPEDPKAAPIAQDAEFQDEDIEIPDEGTPGAEAPATDAPAEPPREKKRRGPKRYAALTHERDEARGYAANLEAELARERKRADEADAKATEAAKVSMQTFAAKAETDLKEARREHQAAQESGDAERITAAAEQLASAKQTADDVKAYQATEQARPAAAPAPAAPAPQQYQEPYAPNIKAWVMKDHNRYWDQNARDASGNVILDRGGRPVKNPEFDEEMHIEATMYATKLERQIANGKASFKTGDAQYLQAIEEHMAKEFPDYFGAEDEDETPAPAPRRASPVASPSPRAATASSNAPGANKVRLSADQLRFIQKQVDNGGGPKYPSGHPKAHRPMTFDDAKVSFARRLQSQAKEQ